MKILLKRFYDINEKFLSSIDTCIPKLSDESKNILDQQISKKECYDAILSMKKNKTPGYDGFPVEFYIVFWPDISDMLINSYKYSIDNGLMSASSKKWHYHIIT